MAIRKIREIGDEVLTKTCKEVPKMTLRNKILIGDMLDTMYEAMGVGLAAPQVGVLKRIVVTLDRVFDRSCKPQDRGNFRRTDRRRRLLKRAGKSRTGDKTGLCQSGCTE